MSSLDIKTKSLHNNVTPFPNLMPNTMYGSLIYNKLTGNAEAVH